MNKNLIKTVEEIVNSSIQEYIKKVSNKYSISVEELNDLINQDIEDLSDLSSDNDSIISESSTETNCNICRHVIGGSSARKGQLCGKPVKCMEAQLCKTHLDAKEKKSAKAIVKKAKASIIMHPEIGKHFCETTGLIFEKNGSNFEAVGIYKNQEIKDLDSKDLKTCKIFNYLVKAK
jgi:hypothetical protein